MDLRYPVGPWKMEGESNEETRRESIEQIEGLPVNIRAAVKELAPEQLDTPYRPGGWSVRQVVHHLADSHLNAYTRFRLALTEENPLIKPYDEQRWAELSDARTAPIETSLALLDGLHQRWAMLLRSLRPADFKRTLRHPERGVLALDYLLAMYAWHCRHHTAHITSLRERMGWR